MEPARGVSDSPSGVGGSAFFAPSALLRNRAMALMACAVLCTVMAIALSIGLASAMDNDNKDSDRVVVTARLHPTHGSMTRIIQATSTPSALQSKLGSTPGSASPITPRPPPTTRWPSQLPRIWDLRTQAPIPPLVTAVPHTPSPSASPSRRHSTWLPTPSGEPPSARPSSAAPTTAPPTAAPVGRAMGDTTKGVLYKGHGTKKVELSKLGKDVNRLDKRINGSTAPAEATMDKWTKKVIEKKRLEMAEKARAAREEREREAKEAEASAAAKRRKDKAVEDEALRAQAEHEQKMMYERKLKRREQQAAKRMAKRWVQKERDKEEERELAIEHKAEISQAHAERVIKQRTAQEQAARAKLRNLIKTQADAVSVEKARLSMQQQKIHHVMQTERIAKAKLSIERKEKAKLQAQLRASELHKPPPPGTPTAPSTPQAAAAAAVPAAPAVPAATATTAAATPPSAPPPDNTDMIHQMAETVMEASAGVASWKSPPKAPTKSKVEAHTVVEPKKRNPALHIGVHNPESLQKKAEDLQRNMAQSVRQEVRDHGVHGEQSAQQPKPQADAKPNATPRNKSPASVQDALVKWEHTHGLPRNTMDLLRGARGPKAGHVFKSAIDHMLKNARQQAQIVSAQKNHAVKTEQNLDHTDPHKDYFHTPPEQSGPQKGTPQYALERAKHLPPSMAKLRLIAQQQAKARQLEQKTEDPWRRQVSGAY